MFKNLLICMVGLPRSGKSTWAKNHGAPIVNPDSIRLALHGKAFIKEAEPYVWAIARTMVQSLFLAGHNKVILDATNVTKKRREEGKNGFLRIGILVLSWLILQKKFVYKGQKVS